LRPSRSSFASHRSLAVVSVTILIVVGAPVAALGDWNQFQGSPQHDGLSDGPTAPLSVAWTNEDIDLGDTGTTGGLSSPIVAEDGTIVVVAPTEVLGFDGEDGSEVFSTDRDLGPSSQPAIAQGPEGPIVVFTEGFGDAGPLATGTASASPSPSPSGVESEEEEFDSHVNAVDLATGEPAWESRVSLDDVVQTPVAVDKSSAYVGDVGGRVTAVDLATGDVAWAEELGTPISGAVTLDAGRALVTTLGGRDEPSEVVALDAETGEDLWHASAEDASNLVSAPVVAEGRVLTLDAIGGIVAFDAEDGRFLWRSEVINPIAPRGQPFLLQGVGAPAPVAADGGVYAVDVTGRVYAFDAETGAPLWDHALNDPSQFSPPLLTSEHVLVSADSGILYAVDRRTGHLVWQTEGGGAFLRGISDAGDVLVGVTGFENATVVTFGADQDGPLIDEPSPTTLDIGLLLTGFLLGGVVLGLVVVVLARPLQRRLGPALAVDTFPGEELA
jgi:outer membrane protein assembly factor BamB